MYLQEAKDMPELIAQYLHRFNNVTAVYSSLFELGSTDKERLERCWQEIVALSVGLDQCLGNLGWSWPGGDDLGLFRSAYTRLAGAAPNDEDEVLDALVSVKEFALRLRDLIKEGKKG